MTTWKMTTGKNDYRENEGKVAVVASIYRLEPPKDQVMAYALFEKTQSDSSNDRDRKQNAPGKFITLGAKQFQYQSAALILLFHFGEIH